MAVLTTLSVSITPELDSFLQSRVASGRNRTASEVVVDALRLLEQQETERDVAFLELQTKFHTAIAEANRGDLLDGDVVFEELKEMIEAERKAQAVPR